MVADFVALKEERLKLDMSRGKPSAVDLLKRWVDLCETAGERLCAIHIADNEGDRDQHLLPFGTDNGRKTHL